VSEKAKYDNNLGNSGAFLTSGIHGAFSSPNVAISFNQTHSSQLYNASIVANFIG
jgi:hypothetical protein